MKKLLTISAFSLLVSSVSANAQTTFLNEEIGFVGQDVCPPGFIQLPESLAVAEDVDPASLPSYLEADQIEFLGEEKKILTGNVVVEQGRRGIYSDKLTYDEVNYRANAEGNVRYYSEDGSLLVSDELDFEIDTFFGAAENAKFELTEQWQPDAEPRKHYRFDEDYTLFAPFVNGRDEETAERIEEEMEALFESYETQDVVSGRGAAETIDFEGLELMTLKNARYTSCPRGNDDVVITADELEIDQIEGVGRAKSATVRFKDVPIFYTPYLSFPINDDRKSGFLFPEYGYENNSGYIVGAPYYWNISPQMDATLGPRYLSNRGVQLFGEYRFLTDTGGYGTFRGEYLNKDDYSDGGQNEFEGDSRYGFGFDYDHRLNNNWQVDIDLQKVSDVDYLDDFSNNLDIVASSYVPQRGSIRYSGPDYFFETKLSAYEVVNDDISESSEPYERLPEISFDVRPRDLGVFEFGTETQFDYFNTSDNARDTGARLLLEPYLQLPLEEVYGYVTPKVQLYSLHYSLDAGTPNADGTTVATNSRAGDSPSMTVPIFSVDSGLYFERLFDTSKGSYLQTLEPRLFLLSIQDESKQEDFPDFDSGITDINSYSQLFRENRFFGGDRLGDTQQATVGLTSRIIDEEEGDEKFSFKIGQIYYFKDREIFVDGTTEDDTSDVSDLLTEATANIGGDWNMTSFARWDQETRDVETFRVSADYDHSLRRKFSVGYINERSGSDTQQFDLRLRQPIARHWQVDSYMNYSLENNEVLGSEYALTYDSCCWALRLGYQRYLIDTDEYNDRFILTFQIDQLGSIGSGR